MGSVHFPSGPVFGGHLETCVAEETVVPQKRGKQARGYREDLLLSSWKIMAICMSIG
jgi:hypothetical protein